MSEKITSILAKLISLLLSWHTKLVTSNQSGIIYPALVSTPMVFYAGKAHFNMDAPLAVVHIKKGCEFYGRIVALTVINEGLFQGIMITNELKNYGICDAQTSVIRSLESFSGSELTGDLNVEARRLVIHQGANIQAILKPQKDINLSQYQIIIYEDEWTQSAPSPSPVISEPLSTHSETEVAAQFDPLDTALDDEDDLNDQSRGSVIEKKI